MPNRIVLVVFMIFCGFMGNAQTQEKLVFEDVDLQIWQVSPHAYRHVSYLLTSDFGKVPCNGMVVVDGNEAAVFDTPTSVGASEILLKWIRESLHATVKFVVPTHFHNDCLGGLSVFHAHNIASWAHSNTISFAKEHGEEVPLNGIVTFPFGIKVGKKTIKIDYLGEGHTRDNVVAYFSDEKVLFGGCLIKELGASKGFLGDANVADWSKTVTKVKQSFPNTQVVIPGHGLPGGTKLFDYTIQLFTP